MTEKSSIGVVTHSDVDDLQDLIRKRIEVLRPKLLDLSRRNPLISTKLTPRSTSHVRVVDEVPDVLFENLTVRKEMRFSPLPALDEDPRDEQSREFQNALSEARMTDKEWLASVEDIDPSSEENFELYRKAERQLKDRVRATLGMTPRQTSGETSLKQHALINGISPAFDLPLLSEAHEDGRHQDTYIQTLLLPDDLERKMNGLMTKCRTWIQETGIHVLYSAFGFLEWIDPRTNDSSFAPLVLLAVELEKHKTRNGLEFRVVGSGDDAETNTVLAEKLKNDFGLELPKYSEGSLEDYFKQVAAISPKGLSWKVRRQVVFGVFPSARIAMYHDLDTANSFSCNEAVSKLFGGTSSEIASAYGDEYEIDHPEIESKVPCLVLDADSSQFSTMVDIANGKDLAVEGPPGTGKSQTIVNTIAAVLSEGKKVLFVAEKLAALDVVKSRLEAIGLGEFILPLQAERSTREQVVQSIKDRIDMTPGRQSADLEYQIDKFKQTRADLQSYIDAISELVGQTGLRVFDILGKAIALNDFVDSLPKPLQNARVDQITEYNRSRIDTIKDVCNSVESAWNDICKVSDYWRGLKILNIDRFTADEVCQLAENTAHALQSEIAAKQALVEVGIDRALTVDDIEGFHNILVGLIPLAAKLDLDTVRRFLAEPDLEAIFDFLDSCETLQAERKALSELFSNELTEDLPATLHSIHGLFAEQGIASLDTCHIQSEIDAGANQLDELRKVYDAVKHFVAVVPDSSKWALSWLTTAAKIASNTSGPVLSARRDEIANPSSFEIIAQCSKLGRDLQKRRDQLEAVMSLSRISISTDVLSSHIRSMSSGSIFRRLMPDYHAAKRFYLGITRRQGFDRELAVKDLNALLDWKDDLSRLISNEQALKVFGADFGIDTNFNLFDELVLFYQRVESDLPKLEQRELRKFLKAAEIDLVRAIPIVSEDSSDRDFNGVFAEIEALELTIEKLKSMLTELEKRSSVLKHPKRITVDDLPELAGRVEKFFQTKRRLDASGHVKEIVGKAFAGANTDKSEIDTELAAIDVFRSSTGIDPNPILHLIQSGKQSEAASALRHYLDRHREAAALLNQLCERTGISLDELGARERDGSLEDYLYAAAGDKEGLQAHSAYATALDELHQQGFAWLTSALLEHGRALENLAFTFEAVLFRALAKFVHTQHGPVLSKFTGRKLDECRDRLARLDREILELSRRHLRAKLHKIAKPPRGVGVGRKSEWTNMALLENELAKKKGFISVRELTHRAGKALLELKPCWMMSPLAVAQYLRKDEITFDLVIIDEASQMPPEDALGALIRGKQVMVVGDTNQLPPTTFFKKMVDDDSVDQDEAVLEESILEMANAAFRPARRLRWHYRSRHSALINFSNQMVYNGDLIVFPSASERRPDMGVSLVSVNGRYSSGVNGEEAKAMIDAALNFVKTSPNRSLGLVVLNQKQRDLLLEEWEFVLSREPAAARYVERWSEQNDGLESFFIKNLENVQGDERDVIFIGTVCGPEEVGGPVDHRSFGPINGLAGKRRLNVLFSRAKEQIVTFSSMTSADIRADENSNAGVYMLKRWLEYSATGHIHTGIQTNKATDSDFEDYVIKQIRSMGCEPVPQVGVAGYFIDIGVRHPEWPHGYIMGVECDGASYHSSKSARDRDRLRQEVLENLGWRLHRIWSTDWFNDPRKQAERLREVIGLRVNELCATYSATTLSTGGNSNQEQRSSRSKLYLEDEDEEEGDEREEEEPGCDYEPDNESGTERRAPEEVSAAEITESILAVLSACPNNSCTLSSLTKRVLKHLGLLTRGKPRARFKKRVMQAVTNLVYKEALEKYRAKNERVRLPAAQRQLTLLN